MDNLRVKNPWNESGQEQFVGQLKPVYTGVDKNLYGSTFLDTGPAEP